MAIYTAGDQINRALRLLGVLAEGETPSASVSQDALMALNQMIDFGQAEARYFKKQNYLMEQAPHLEMLRRSIPKPGADEGQRRRRHAGIVFKNATKIDQIGKLWYLKLSIFNRLTNKDTYL